MFGCSQGAPGNAVVLRREGVGTLGQQNAHGHLLPSISFFTFLSYFFPFTRLFPHPRSTNLRWLQLRAGWRQPCLSPPSPSPFPLRLCSLRLHPALTAAGGGWEAAEPVKFPLSPFLQKKKKRKEKTPFPAMWLHPGDP